MPLPQLSSDLLTLTKQLVTTTTPELLLNFIKSVLGEDFSVEKGEPPKKLKGDHSPHLKIRKKGKTALMRNNGRDW
jgi:hypothetical protein